MKGREVRLEPLADGGHAAALIVDGRLQDLLIDPPDSDTTPRPEAIYRGVAGRPMKGLGGMMISLDDGRSGYLRGARGLSPGQTLIVQVATWAEPGKAPPLTDRVLLRGRFAILTPGAPGRSVARSIRDPDRRGMLAAVAERAMAGADAKLGVIVRSAAAGAVDTEVESEICALRDDFERALAIAGVPALLMGAPGAGRQARREWTVPGTPVTEARDALSTPGIWEEVSALLQPEVLLPHGTMFVEATRALVAIDVNTGGDSSPAAALKANLAAARELPRQLRLRGLGGQIAVDFAPLAKAQRSQVEGALTAALRADGIETTIAGWTSLGHLELQRKRARRPLLPGQAPD
jgi:ribonuclease G